MPAVKFTKEDLLSRQQITAGWYKLNVKDITEKPGTNDPTSLTYPASFVVAEGPSTGVPVRKYFTEKQMGDFSNFLACFVTGGIEVGKDYDYTQAIGRFVMGYCRYNTDMNWNEVVDFKKSA